ncbi:ABC transporter permease [Paenibacillus sp. P3E]|uniref:ABC transporter permease n=1 Tax=Paenibacillus sp. P3E TaxID=1349435 RepID=UPI00211600B9|nr:hypothetical protein [Paenibacillus sp. P3E]
MLSSIKLGTALSVKRSDLTSSAPMNVATSWNMVIISFLFSWFTGVVFGMMPANKAARMCPIYALRNE